MIQDEFFEKFSSYFLGENSNITKITLQIYVQFEYRHIASSFTSGENIINEIGRTFVNPFIQEIIFM